MSLTQKQISQINQGYIETNVELFDTTMEMSSFCRQIETENKDAYEYGFYGILRRLFLIRKCIENFISITPPERNYELDGEDRKNLNLFLHSFLLHIAGSIDNLAWVWFYYKRIHEIKDPEKFKFNINLFGKKFKKYLDQEIVDKCSEFKNWYKLLKDFRNPAAHRISPYIVPYTVDPKDADKHRELEKKLNETFNKPQKDLLQTKIDALRDYEPAYMHSFNEGSQMVRFHPQAIADSRSLCVLIKLVLKCL